MKQFLGKNKYRLIVVGLLLIYVVVFFSIGIWKYYNLKYDELDLAIFDQTMYNSVHGDWFANSIQQQNYTGDHFAPILFLLMPFYAMVQHPLTLVLLQLLGIAAAGWVLYKIVYQVLGKELYGILFVFLFVMNFTVQDMSLFGFHVLPFTILGIFGMYYFYQQSNYVWYIISIIACLLIREDVALLIIPWSIIPLLDKRSLKWWFVPFVMGGIYFIGALKIISLFNISGGYKFLIYYGWLGDSFFGILKGFFLQPLNVLKHVLRFSTLEYTIGFLMPLFFIPLLGWRYLLPLVFIFASQVLQGLDPGNLVLQTHYGALFIPFIFLAALFGVQRLQSWKHFKIVVIVLVVAVVYSWIYVGPVKSVFAQITDTDSNNRSIVNSMVKQVPSDAGIITTSDVIPLFSRRNDVYSLHYLFMGKKQFSDQPYEIPTTVEYMLLNMQEFKFYDYQTQLGASIAPFFGKGDDRIREFLDQNNFSVVAYGGNYILFQKNTDKQPVLLYKNFDQDFSGNNLDKHLGDSIDLVRMQTPSKISFGLRPIDLTFYTRKKMDRYAYIGFTSGNKEVVYPLGVGLLPVGEWSEGEYITLRYWIPDDFNLDDLLIDVFHSEGQAYFDYAGSIVLRESQRIPL